MEHFLVRRNCHGLRSIYHSFDVGPHNFTVADGNNAVTVHAADMTACNTCIDRIDLTTSHQIEGARQIQYDLVKLFDTMIYSAEFPEGFRAAVNLRGFNMGHGRQPLSTEQRTDITALSNELQCMLAAHGFTDQPIGGCPIDANAGGGEAEVSAIVQQVVAELNRRGLM